MRKQHPAIVALDTLAGFGSHRAVCKQVRYSPRVTQAYCEDCRRFLGKPINRGNNGLYGDAHTGLCATLQGGQTTRNLLFIAGHQVARSRTRPAPCRVQAGRPSSSWRAALSPPRR